ncbi:MAG: hypothetical protein QNJ98_11875 [Planctomycetota bacterium]|nr:hypothetical protein [Planctomycetota bacterium]
MRPLPFVLLTLALLGLAACGSGGGPTKATALIVSPLTPGPGLHVSQVDFQFPKGQLPFSTWGRLWIDPAQLMQRTGVAGGVLNVALDDRWVIVNLPLMPPTEPAYAVYFDLGLAQPTPLKLVSLHVKHSNRGVGRIDEHMDQPDLWPIDRWIYDAEGISPVIDPGPPPLTMRVADRVRADLEPSGWTQMVTNEQCAHMQCMTMAMANALEYLDDMGVVSIPHTHTAGLLGDATLVGQLDTLSGRWAASRDNGGGLWFTPLVDGTFQYLSDNGLTGTLAQRHQDDGYGTPPGQSLPAGDYAFAGSTTQDDGASVTFDWILDRIRGGSGVIVVFSYDSGGGHAVRITGAGRNEDGDPWVRYSHDARQTNSDASDTRGLENVVIELTDTDGDGRLNFGSPSREVEFAWAHR